MKKNVFGAAALCLLLLCAYAVTFSPSGSAGDAAPQPASAATAEPPRSAEALFPQIDENSDLHLSILTADRAFEFVRAEGCISVNGNQADSEVFSTLIRQVVDMPIFPREAFSPEAPPVMTICVILDDAKHTASFYESPQEDEADVLYAHHSGKYYGVTDAWRVGTLLLACDGTRILDEGGNEAPALHP